MRSPASITKHPIHPVLVVFPIGLWIVSLMCDLIGLRIATPAVWFTAAFYTMVGGWLGALAAAVPGLIDLLYYKGGAPPVKNIALTHKTIDLAVVLLCGVNIWLRIGSQKSTTAPISLSAVGVGMLAVSGWLGGQMVNVYGVGVETSV